MRTNMRAFLVLAASAALSLPLASQVMPGEAVCTVIQSATGEMWIANPQTGKATQLKMSVAAQVNCIEMFTPALGWVGTVDDPAHIYRVTITGNNATLTSLMKTPTALAGRDNVSQITRVGADLWFATNIGGVATAGGEAMVYKIPMAGGSDPTLVVDLTKVTGWNTSSTANLANAITSNGTSKVWVAIWNANDLYEIDAATGAAKLLMKLPFSKIVTTTFLPVHMRYRGGNLEVFSLYGDVVVIDPATQKTIAHYSAKVPGTGNLTYHNSGIYNPDSDDYLCGSRAGFLNTVVPVGPGQRAREVVTGVGSNATNTSNSVTGIGYTSAGGDYDAYDAGCPGSGTYAPTSVGRGPAVAGNSGFAFGLHATPLGVNVAILILGGTKVKVPLAGIGLGGCNLLATPDILLPVATNNSTMDGLGEATIPVPLPNVKATLHTQWLVYHAVNQKFDAISDGRTLTLK